MKAEDVIEIYQMLTAKKVDVWLDGGWGVDALLGRQTRPHKDVDIVIKQKDVHEVRELLEKQRYKEIKLDIARPHNFVLGDEEGHEVDVHVIVLDEDGNGIYGPKENGEAYPEYSLKGEGTIKGYKVKCLSAKYQIESHSGYKVKEKDIKDVTALCKKFGIDLSSEYKHLSSS